MDALEKNRQYVDSCIQIAELLYSKGYEEECVSYIEKIATFAWCNFSGYYKSQKLENILIKIGSTLPAFDETKLQPKKINHRKILHICSEVYATGGHTKLLFSWIEIDRESDHTVMSTRMSLDRLKKVTEKYISGNISLVSVEGESHIEKVKFIKNTLYENYDLIVLHVHPNEVSAVIALSDENIKIPVLFLNHADHTFWLGVSVLDRLLQIRDVNILPDQKKRGIDVERQKFLPIPIKLEHASEKIEKKDNRLYILTTGTEYKYAPNKEYNFFKEITEVLNRFPEVVVNVVGVNPKSKYAIEYAHPRLNFLGTLLPVQLKNYEDITDIYLEGFPVPSFTSLLQAGIKGIPFLLHYNPATVFRLCNENSENYVVYPKNLNEWHQSLNSLISDNNYRLKVAQHQQKFIQMHYSSENWAKRLNQIYGESENIKHQIYNSGNDLAFNNQDEKILMEMKKIKINHFLHTERLNLKHKFILIFSTLRNRPQAVQYYKGLRLIKYIFSN